MAKDPRQVVTQARTRSWRRPRTRSRRGKGSWRPRRRRAATHQLRYTRRRTARRVAAHRQLRVIKKHDRFYSIVLTERSQADLSFSHCLKNGGWGLDGTLFLGTTFGTPDRSIPGQERLHVNNGRL